MKRKIIQTAAFLIAVCLMTTALSGCSFSAIQDVMKNRQEKITLGTVDGDCWENEYLGFGCRLEGYTFFSQEEIEELNQLTVDMLDNEAYTQALESALVIQSMYAHKNSQLDTVNVVMEKVTAESESYTEQQFAQAGKKATEEAMSSLLEDLSITIGTTTFLGQEHTAITVRGKANGMNLVQKQVTLRYDSYFCIVTASSYSGMDPDDMLANFYTLD